MDLPGFGFSDRPWPYDYTAGGEARGLVRYLEARGIDRAVLVGNSLGGAETMLVAAEHPGLVEGLVLVAPATPTGTIPWPVRILRVPGLGGLAFALSTRPVVAFGLRHKMYARASRVTESAIDDAWRPLGVPGTRRAALQAIRTNPEAYLGLEERIRVPTLVLWGESDKMLPPAEARRLAAKIAGARLVILPDAGHLPQRERPAEFAVDRGGLRLAASGYRPTLAARIVSRPEGGRRSSRRGSRSAADGDQGRGRVRIRTSRGAGAPKAQIAEQAEATVGDAYCPQRSATRAVITRGSGGVSPRPSVCIISWMRVFAL